MTDNTFAAYHGKRLFHFVPPLSLAMVLGLTLNGADFTRMLREGGIRIDEVRYKTFVDVNEQGTEAAKVVDPSGA